MGRSIIRACVNFVTAAALLSRTLHPVASHTLPSAAPPVLLFVAVGVAHLELMRDNVLALKQSYSLMEFFFCHYDGVEGWEAYASHEWYRRTVGNHSVSYAASKPQFVYTELVEGMRIRTNPWLKRFRYFWFADDNMNMTKTDALALVALFARSGAAIGQPAVERSIWKYITWPTETDPTTACAFRYVPLVEVWCKFVPL